MPSPQNSYLTEADHQRILVYKEQGLTLTVIATEIGCSVATVWNHLRKVPKKPPSVAITHSQYQVIQRYEKSNLHLKDLAARLETDSLVLGQELVGAKSMSTKRIGQLKKILAENSVDENAPAG